MLISPRAFHDKKIFKGFTSQYDVDKLVYYESSSDVYRAIYREKCIKKWNRKWKMNLIERDNLDWNDLSEGCFVF